MNIFKELVLSVYSYGSYKEFLKNRRSKVFGFGLMLVLLYFIITIGIPYLMFHLETGGYGAMIEEYVPDFELEDGYLQIDEVFEYDHNGTYFYVDTDQDLDFGSAEELKEFLDDYSQVILVGREKYIAKDGKDIVEIFYEDLRIEYCKDDLQEFVPFAYVATVLIMICIYIWDVLLFFLGVVIVALVAMISASCMKVDLTFGQLYMMGVYSRTLPLLIKALVSFLPITIPGFFIINFAISVMILIYAMQKMKEAQLQKPLEFHSDDDFSWRK